LAFGWAAVMAVLDQWGLLGWACL